jgi:hypothetical protein
MQVVLQTVKKMVLKPPTKSQQLRFSENFGGMGKGKENVGKATKFNQLYLI